MVSESEASKLKMHADVGDNEDMSVGMKTGSGLMTRSASARGCSGSKVRHARSQRSRVL